MGGTSYVNGYYDAPSSAFSFTGSDSVAYGTGNIAYGAHAFIITPTAGLVVGTDIEVKVSGAYYVDSTGVLAAGSEIITSNLENESPEMYLETNLKWVGQVTFQITTGAPTDTGTLNYGYSKYEDVGDRKFNCVYCEFQGKANGSTSEADLEIQLLKHQATGWTYSASNFVPGSFPAIVDFKQLYTPFCNLANGQNFAFKRTGIYETVRGDLSEGILWRMVHNGNTYDVVNIAVGVTVEF